jgi:hypothetical protein
VVVTVVTVDVVERLETDVDGDAVVKPDVNVESGVEIEECDGCGLVTFEKQTEINEF